MERPFFMTRRYVMRDYDSESEIDKFCSAFGWQGIAGYPEDLEAGTPRRLVWEVMPGLTINSAQDSHYHVTYVAAMSALSPDELEPLEVIIDAALEFVGEDELLEAVASAGTPEAEAHAVVQAGIGAPRDWRADFAEVIERAAESPRPEVRNAAIAAVSFTEWREFTPLLERLAQNDADDSARAAAQRLIDVFSQLDDHFADAEEGAGDA